jgi:16S rRNA (guanine966-N2)-methyltransferase
VRIVAGALGGRRLRAPRGRGTRPTSDRARESLFARLGDIDGLDVLDLFAGSGALGLEALSRGAATCLFVDHDSAAVAAVRANVADLGLEHRTRVRRADSRRVLRDEQRAGRRFGLLLIDPPYTLLPRVLPALGRLLEPVAGPGARIVVEAPTGLAVDLGGLPADSIRESGAAAHHLFTLPS